MNNVFGRDQLRFWEENGYIVLQNAVPMENLTAAVDAIWSFLEIDPSNLENWYSQPPRREPSCTENPNSPISEYGMVKIYQHQALWDNR